MSLFPRSFISDDPVTSFHPLFRLLDDFDRYSRDTTGRHHHRTGLRTFTPKFDVREISDAYELHGELPGIDQKDVEIEFTDDQTLTVKGRTAHSYSRGTPPSGFIESPSMSGAITEAGEHDAHKRDDANVEKGEATTGTDVAKEDQPKDAESKFWVSERSVGEFSRSFSFPVRVDQDRVQASMKNGILSILVPKSKKVESRKITIS